MMSGTAFLEEVVTWDDEKRAEKVEEALPRLIMCLENYKSYDEAVGILQILCQSFVPVVQQEQLEDKVFCRMSLQVCQLLDAVLEEVHEAVTQSADTDTDHLIALLQHVVSVSQCVEECVKHMAAMADLHTHHVRSLMTCSFHILKGSYSHCQESGTLYGDILPTLSETLSLIFRTAHSLQMVLLNMLDVLVSPHPLSEQAVEDLSQVCAGVFAVCRVVASLDLKLTISLWKALSKLVGPQASELYGHMDISGIVAYLCGEIRAGTTQLLHSAPPANPHGEENLLQGDEKVFQKSLRILSFQVKVLIALVRDFHPFLSDCVPDLHKLLLTLNSVLPPNLSAARLQAKHEEELRQQLCNASQSLLLHLLNNASFPHCVLSAGAEPKRELASLLVMIMAMDAVAQASVDVVSIWLGASSTPSSTSSTCNGKPGSSLLSVVFSTLDACHTEVCLPVYLPGLPCEGKPSRNVSLYQYVVEHVSAFIASCPAKLFHVIEKSLVQALLGSSPISSQAAADCWCFMARYGTADLCWHHTQQILSLVLHVRDVATHCTTYRPLTSLLARLIKFLTPQHQMELVTRLPAATHLGVWSDIGVSVFSTEVVTELCGTLLSACFSTVQNFCLSSSPSLSQAAAVVPALQCLHSIAQTSTAVTQQLTAQQGAVLLELVCTMWDMAPSSSWPPLLDSNWNSGRTRDAYLFALVTLTSDIVEQLDLKMLLQVLVHTHKVIKDSASGEIILAALQLLQSLGRLKFPPSVEQGQILRKISDSFGASLTHPAALVQFSALESFTRFAEHTPYEAVVPECLAQHEGLQEKVAAYLQKTPLAEENQFDTVCYLQNQHQQFEARLKQNGTQPPRPLPSDTSEPPSKRQKRDDSKDTDQLHTLYQNTLEELESAVDKLEKLRGDGPIPDWAETRGKSLLQRLSLYLDHR